MADGELPARPRARTMLRRLRRAVVRAHRSGAARRVYSFRHGTMRCNVASAFSPPSPRRIDRHTARSSRTPRATASAILRWMPGPRDEAAAMRDEEPPPTRAWLASGSWTLLLERLDAPHTPLYLFGAGHVGRALISVLSGLPFKVTWVDGRNGVFPDVLPANVTAHASPDPAELVRDAAPDACFLVLTHSHALDYEICREILQAGPLLLRRTDRLAHQGRTLRASPGARRDCGGARRTAGVPHRDRGHQQPNSQRRSPSRSPLSSCVCASWAGTSRPHTSGGGRPPSARERRLRAVASCRSPCIRHGARADPA